MQIRRARLEDAEALADVLRELAEAGKRSKPADAAFIRAQYLSHPDLIRCSLCEDSQGTVLGLQSLKRAAPGNPYGTPAGWGIIGTHVRPSAARRGVGAALFAASEAAAREAELTRIEAYIGATNAAALAYYAALGFVTWREDGDAIAKVFTLP